MALGKRYEIYLTIEYNLDEHGNRLRIEEEKLDQTYEELWQEFRGVTVTPESQNQALRGFWLDEAGQLFKDKVFTAIVYATDINKADHFFRQALNVYKERFQQKEILILSMDSRKDRIAENVKHGQTIQRRNLRSCLARCLLAQSGRQMCEETALHP